MRTKPTKNGRQVQIDSESKKELPHKNTAKVAMFHLERAYVSATFTINKRACGAHTDNTSHVAVRTLHENKLKQEFMQSIRRMPCCVVRVNLASLGRPASAARCRLRRFFVCVSYWPPCYRVSSVVFFGLRRHFFHRSTELVYRLANLQCNRPIAGNKQRLSHIKSR